MNVNTMGSILSLCRSKKKVLAKQPLTMPGMRNSEIDAMIEKLYGEIRAAHSRESVTREN